MRRLNHLSQWFLIDWDDATTPPTKGITHMEKDTHAPGVRIDGHGPEVDIWAVGGLNFTFRGIVLIASTTKSSSMDAGPYATIYGRSFEPSERISICMRDIVSCNRNVK